MARFRGINFPFSRGLQSFPEKVSDDELLRQSMIQIIMTPRGERVMRPDFGADAYALIFANTGDVFEQDIKNAVMSAIAQYEPRVIVLDVRVTEEDTKTGGGQSEVKIDIDYVVLATRESQTISLQVPCG